MREGLDILDSCRSDPTLNVLTLLDIDGGKGAVEVTRLLIGELGFLDVDLGTVNLGVGVRGHGCCCRRRLLKRKESRQKWTAVESASLATVLYGLTGPALHQRIK